ncbi:hypothetical protein CFBP2118_01396 [Pseudomonas syringae pv. syringae]|nr:hypothetical protein CFBP2118_01396 [Pseudomonas syringae pv. syringae]
MDVINRKFIGVVFDCLSVNRTVLYICDGKVFLDQRIKIKRNYGIERFTVTLWSRNIDNGIDEFTSRWLFSIECIPNLFAKVVTKVVLQILSKYQR